MKRIIFNAGVVLGVLLLNAAAASAAPIGRPTAYERSWSLGGIISVERTNVESRSRATNGDLESELFLIDAGYAFQRDAEFFVRLGVTADDYRASGSSSTSLGTGLAWGVGTRGVLYNSYRSWRILGDLQYLSRPGRDFGISDIDIREFQLAGAVEVRAGDIFPYGGLLYRRLDLKSSSSAVVPESRNEQEIGVYLGVGFEPRREWAGYAEIQFASGLTGTAGLNYRF